MKSNQVAPNPSSSEPLFLQVQKDLASKIQAGDYPAGNKLPNELQLAEQYGVGRITVRRAISELADQGMLVKRQGKGTFIREHRIFRKIEHTTSFSEACRMNGLKATSKIIVHEVLPLPSESFPDSLKFSGDSVLHIQRLRLANDTPVTIEDNFYTLPRLDFLLNEDLESSSLFKVFRKHGIEIPCFENSYIETAKATLSQASLLSIPVGDPLFFFHEEALDKNDSLLFVGNQHIAGSRYRFYYDRG